MLSAAAGLRGEIFDQNNIREFLGSPMVRTWYLHCHGPRFSPWSGTKSHKPYGTECIYIYISHTIYIYIARENNSIRTPKSQIHEAKQVEMHNSTIIIEDFNTSL